MTESDGIESREYDDVVDAVLVGVAAFVCYRIVTRTMTSSTLVLGATVAPVLLGRLSATIDLSVPLQRAVFGVVVASLGVAIAAFTASTWLGPVGAAVGCWIVLDAVYASRARESDGNALLEERSARTALTRTEHSRSVVDALETASRPLTVDELRERTGLGEDDLEATLEVVRDNGTVERIGTGYAVGERERRPVTVVREIVSSVVGRLLRPFRLFRPSR